MKMGSVSAKPNAADLFFQGIDAAGADARISNCHRLFIVATGEAWTGIHAKNTTMFPGNLEPRPKAPVSHRQGR